MIEDEPSTWRGLQDRVAAILSESGVLAAVEKEIYTARRKVNIDVWAQDEAATPPQVYLIECKRWDTPVTKSTVHAFRTVVGDSGANWGGIISTRGFQRGAHDAALYSNVRLLTWLDFQTLFLDRWFERYFLTEAGRATDPLLDYTAPINSRISRKAEALSRDGQYSFVELRGKHRDLASLSILFRAHAILGESAPRGKAATEFVKHFPALPLRRSLPIALSAGSAELPSILDATTLRQLLDGVVATTAEAVSEFDAVFGGRA